MGNIMDIDILKVLREILVRIPVVFFALGLHEWAHAFVAVKLGDDTPKKLKRLTPNPLKHIDPVGMVVFFVFGFGWSRPIPINPIRFKNKFWNILAISLAGPIFSLLLAFITGVIFYGLGFFQYSYFFNINASDSNFIIMYLADLMGYFMIVNFIIFIFNLLPFMPLDVSKIWMAFLTSKHMKNVIKYQIYGILILLILIILGAVSLFMDPIIKDFQNSIIKLFDWLK